MKSVSVLVFWCSQRLSKCDSEESKSKVIIMFQESPESFLFKISATNCKLASLLFIGINHYTWKTMTPALCSILYNCVHTSLNMYDLVCRLSALWPPVLAASGSAAADGIVLTVKQAVQTKLNQDNFLLVSGAAGAGPYCTFTDKVSWPRLSPSTLSIYLLVVGSPYIQFKESYFSPRSYIVTEHDLTCCNCVRDEWKWEASIYLCKLAARNGNATLSNVWQRKHYTPVFVQRQSVFFTHDVLTRAVQQLLSWSRFTDFSWMSG